MGIRVVLSVARSCVYRPHSPCAGREVRGACGSWTVPSHRQQTPRSQEGLSIQLQSLLQRAGLGLPYWPPISPQGHQPRAVVSGARGSAQTSVSGASQRAALPGPLDTACPTASPSSRPRDRPQREPGSDTDRLTLS